MNAPSAAPARAQKFWQKFWIAVASADHVRIGRAGGFMQVCHGKAAPLRRIAPGDGVVYYSPATAMRGTDRLRAFTAIGVVREGAPYQVTMRENFTPFRRDVAWFEAQETPIAPLLDALDFSAGKRNWAAPFRFGLVEIGARDFAALMQAMRAQGDAMAGARERPVLSPTGV